MFRTLFIMYRNEGGIRALYRGIIPTIAGVAPYVRLTVHHDIVILIKDRLALILWYMKLCEDILNTNMNRTLVIYESYWLELYLAPLHKLARILCMFKIADCSIR